ncbi:MAG: hypothetical protein JXR73_15640 [Candidatus Omnitrophica bacterium]|nr:hypothetical protein [Candidatus Omnitrophota bacterium]
MNLYNVNKNYLFILLIAIHFCSHSASSSDLNAPVYLPSLREDVNQKVQELSDGKIIQDVLINENNEEAYLRKKTDLKIHLLALLRDYENASFSHDLIVKKSSIYTIAANLKIDEIIPAALQDISLCLTPYQGSSTFKRVIEKQKELPTDRPVFFLIRSCGKNSIPYLISWISDSKNPLLSRFQSAALLKEIDSRIAIPFFDSLLDQGENDSLAFGLKALCQYPIEPESHFWGLVNRGVYAKAHAYLEKLRIKKDG